MSFLWVPGEGNGAQNKQITCEPKIKDTHCLNTYKISQSSSAREISMSHAKSLIVMGD